MKFVITIKEVEIAPLYFLGLMFAVSSEVSGNIIFNVVAQWTEARSI